MSGTIKAVFFDMYNTLARFDPPREELQQRVCKEFGIEVSKRGILKGYVAADDYMAQENARHPLAKRSPEERRQFFSEYQRLVLQGAGANVPRERAGEIFSAIRKIPYDLALFEDAIPCLKEVKERGVRIGLITNIDRDVWEVCGRLGLSPYLDFVVTSQEVDSEKPHHPIFRAALEKAGVEPKEALHVGDQYNADVVGAMGAGIKPILIDRDDLLDHVPDCTKIGGLTELLEYL